MLRDLNLISGYGMLAPMKLVLDFNSGLMLGIENMSQDWFNWTRLKQYHDQHLHYLKLSAHISDAPACTHKTSDVGHIDHRQKVLARKAQDGFSIKAFGALWA